MVEKFGSDDIASIAASKGFDLKESYALDEIDGTAHVMRHHTSGARLLYLRNDDSNKSFSITFKTPAADDTGVFHILEHSVLCGSKHYPVKEPFVNLLKTSMQTFLNAMTFPDKTMYPVASTNEQDLENLMSVYLDAVFYPDIYRKETIFQQEGWHLEFAFEEGDRANDDEGAKDFGERPALCYNGVVFNEMKGALSDPDSVLYDTLSAALFPDTTYRFESGGTPEAIPTLTYEAFLDSHRRHYRPDNSYIILYGDLDLERFLGFIDGKYLSPLAVQLNKLKEEGKEPGAINPLDLQHPVIAEGITRTMDTASENSCAAFGFVVGSASERKRVIAADILMDAIMGSNVAPLKKALLEAGIAHDCSGALMDSVAQPFVMIQIKGLEDNAIAQGYDVIRREAARLASGGLDRKIVEAALSHAEFIMREHNFGYADGVIYSMAAMNGWLYDDSMPTAYIEFEAAFAELRCDLQHGYFEDLVRELFLENDHYAQVEVVPTPGEGSAVLKERLDDLAGSMDPEDLARIGSDLEMLRRAQSEPDALEDVAKLPQLTLDDIGKAPSEPSFEPRTFGTIDCLYHGVETRGIAYFYRYFDMSGLAFEDMPYATILTMVLGKLDTAEHTASELDTLIQDKLGNLGFMIEVYEGKSIEGDLVAEDVDDYANGQTDGANKIFPKFVISSSSLESNAAFASVIIEEIAASTDYHDKAKIRDILIQRRVMMEQRFASAGNGIAVSRANSYYSKAAVLREQIGGIDFYSFLKALTNDLDARFDDLIANLERVAQRIFSASNLLSFAGPERALLAYGDASKDAFRPSGASAMLHGGDDEVERLPQTIPAPVDKHEAFVVPTDVTYTALAGSRKDFDGPLSGTWFVTAKILSLDYLWNEVRVVGGAYGVGFTTTRPGATYFHSYRDPHIDETIERFKGAGAWLSSFDPTVDELTGYIVSSTAAFDAPLKPRDLIRRQDGMFFCGYTVAERLMYRSQVVEVKLNDIQALGPAVDKLCDLEHVCTVGNGEVIASSHQDFNIIELLAQNTDMV